MFIARAHMSFGKRRGALVQAEIGLARDQDVESFVADRAVSLGVASSCGLARSAKSQEEHSLEFSSREVREVNILRNLIH